MLRRNLAPLTKLRSGQGRAVESRTGAVAWGLRASAPFPIPAHRTVGPDFRSTALRLASPQGTRRSKIMAGVLGTAHHVPHAVRRMGTGDCRALPLCAV